MAYVINRSDGTAFTTLQDSTIDTTSSLTLVGRNYIGYGEIQNENFLFLLENFSTSSLSAVSGSPLSRGVHRWAARYVRAKGQASHP